VYDAPLEGQAVIDPIPAIEQIESKRSDENAIIVC
jgi:hypothetical protein